MMGEDFRLRAGTLPELDALRQGPRMIGERVRMIGGEMHCRIKARTGRGIGFRSVESSSGEGRPQAMAADVIADVTVSRRTPSPAGM